MKNLNLIFNKTYYEGIGTADFEKKIIDNNRKLFSDEFRRNSDYVESILSSEDEKFLLMTTYPGLLVGTGYPHSTGLSDNELKVGMSFDYVTGQPYIPGSEVKGTLRSYFREDNKARAIAEILRNLTGGIEYSIEDVKIIEEEIFDGHDVFFDAVVERGDYKGRLINSDYITPHNSGDEDPIPIMFPRIRPEVVFEFRFKVYDTGVLDRNTKVTLFKEMLKLFGIGAKTNVGYGRLVEKKDPTPYEDEEDVLAVI